VLLSINSTITAQDIRGVNAENRSIQSSALLTAALGSSTRAMWQRAAQCGMRPHGEVGEITYFAANLPSVPPPLLTGNME